MILLTPETTVGSARDCSATAGRGFLCRVADFVGTFGVEEDGVATGLEGGAAVLVGGAVPAEFYFVRVHLRYGTPFAPENPLSSSLGSS